MLAAAVLCRPVFILAGGLRCLVAPARRGGEVG